MAPCGRSARRGIAVESVRLLHWHPEREGGLARAASPSIPSCDRAEIFPGTLFELPPSKWWRGDYAEKSDPSRRRPSDPAAGRRLRQDPGPGRAEEGQLLLLSRSQYAKALDQFKKGLELDPDATFAWRSVGLSALALYRPGDDEPGEQQYADTAIDAFEKYLADYPDDDKIEDYLMSTMANAKKYDEALAFIDRRIKERPDEAPKLQTGPGSNILMQAGRLDQAFQMASQAPGPGPAPKSSTRSASRPGTSRSTTRSLDHRGPSAQMVDIGLQALQQALDDQAGLLRRDGLLQPALPREGQGRARRRQAPGLHGDRRTSGSKKALEPRKKTAGAAGAARPAKT